MDDQGERRRWRYRDETDDRWSRRHYLATTVGVAALSGCAGAPEDEDGGADTGTPESTDEPDDGDDGDDAADEDTEEDDDTERPPGVSAAEFERGPVPDAYVSATSLGGETRNPDDLLAKADVGFAEYAEALDQPAHQPGHCCANCADYIPDKNGDGFGACAEVEGYVDGADWCTVYEALPEPEVPEGLTAEELATAEVPEAYRTATSQGGEARTPDDLFTQEQVQLTESVEAIAAERASPGQSCGNCSEFIPDTNGDTWGACAAVEGYIAVEDWCTVWESIDDER
jgi:hypothetical protein